MNSTYKMRRQSRASQDSKFKIKVTEEDAAEDDESISASADNEDFEIELQQVEKRSHKEPVENKDALDQLETDRQQHEDAEEDENVSDCFTT
jgi:hypothetical protein